MLFILEPSFATLSICLPAISSLVTRGLKHFPTSSIRSTWSKRSHKFKNTKRASIKTFCPTIRGSTLPTTSSITPADKKLFVVRHGHQSEVAYHPGGDRKPAREASVFTEQLSPSYTRENVPEMRSPTKSIELERRVRQFYRPPALSHGPESPLWEDVEIGIESPLARDLTLDHQRIHM